MEQRFIAQTIFGSRNGMLGRSLEGVDRDKLLDAVKATLRNEDGRTRGAIECLLEPELRRSSAHPARSYFRIGLGLGKKLATLLDE